MNLKFLTAAAVATVISGSAMAQTVYHQDYDGYRDRGPVGTAAGVAAGVAGAAVGTAAAIADAPFRNSYNYYDRDMGPNGYACHPGTWFRGQDGRKHPCQ